jgi:hypothetical protein
LNSEPKEWAARCRKAAAESLFSAENALVPEIAAGHLKLAAGWHALAVEIERALDLEASSSGRGVENFAVPRNGMPSGIS